MYGTITEICRDYANRELMKGRSFLDMNDDDIESLHDRSMKITALQMLSLQMLFPATV